MSKRHHLIQNQSGVALLIVLSSIALLTALLTRFTLETKINKIRSQNIQGSFQAGLNAQAALKLALARLKLYQKAFNELEKNAKIKKMVPQTLVNSIWSEPFLYPIPIIEGNGQIVNNLLQEVNDSIALPGTLNITMRQISGLSLAKLRINPLLERADDLAREKAQASAEENLETPPEENNEDTSENEQLGRAEIQENFIQQMIDLLDNNFNARAESDEYFANRYSDFNAEKLIYALIYYQSEPGVDVKGYEGEFITFYSTHKLTPKYGLIESLSEFNLIPGWDTELYSLISEETTIYPIETLSPEKLTAEFLQTIFPNLDLAIIDEYIAYRDNPDDPRPAYSSNDLKNYFVNVAGAMDEGTFDTALSNLKRAGISLGVSGAQVFEVLATTNAKVEAEGANTALTAVFSLRRKPAPPRKKPKRTSKRSSRRQATTKKTTQKTPLQLESPKLIWIKLN